MPEPMLGIEVNLVGAKPSTDEFILVMVNGTEGISIPYSYDVTLFQKRSSRTSFRSTSSTPSPPYESTRRTSRTSSAS